MKTLFGFTITELLVVAIVLLFTGTVIHINLNISMRRGRDMQRRNDIKAIHDALIAYHNDFSSFPASQDGGIVACLAGHDNIGVPQRRPCDWHVDGLVNIFVEAGEPEIVYIANLPADPLHNSGRRYYYISNGRYFQLYASLEGEDEDEYDSRIVARNLPCGNRVCNFGRGFSGTPLDKSIEEYENELRERELLH